MVEFSCRVYGSNLGLVTRKAAEISEYAELLLGGALWCGFLLDLIWIHREHWACLRLYQYFNVYNLEVYLLRGKRRWKRAVLDCADDKGSRCIRDYVCYIRMLTLLGYAYVAINICYGIDFVYIFKRGDVLLVNVSPWLFMAFQKVDRYDSRA